MRILIVAGARPNFVKVAPVIKELNRHPEFSTVLVHTGQHYDKALSERFFLDLGIPEPDVNLGVGSGTHAEQTAEVLRKIEPVLVERRPDMVLVVGDVNSTLAAALAAAKLGIPVGHIESGLRSNDRTMPEEINRLLVDTIADELFVTEVSGYQNLLREGISIEKIHLVGNVMIDALESQRSRWERSNVHERLGLAPEQDYAVLTLHRPSNVDSAPTLSRLLKAVQALAREIPVILPAHPRARRQLERRPDISWRRGSSFDRTPPTGITCIDPLGYLDCIALMSKARLVLTDSGGIQEETTILKVPCLTLRDSTERPVTVSHGTNRVVGIDPARIVREALRALRQGPPLSTLTPPLWDGRASQRIARILLNRALGVITSSHGHAA